MPNFAPKAAARVVDATRRIERTPRTRPERQRPGRVDLPIVYAIVTSPVGAAARSASQLGSGRAKILRISYDAAGVATYSAFPEDYPVYSGATAGPGIPMAAGSLLMCAYVAGRLHVIVQFCTG
jgi:hypothetical protein